MSPSNERMEGRTRIAEAKLKILEVLDEDDLSYEELFLILSQLLETYANQLFIEKTP